MRYDDYGEPRAIPYSRCDPAARKTNQGIDYRKGRNRCTAGLVLGIVSLVPIVAGTGLCAWAYYSTRNYTDNWGLPIFIALVALGVSVIGLLFGIPAIICSATGLKRLDLYDFRDRRRGIAGLVLGIIALLPAALVLGSAALQ